MKLRFTSALATVFTFAGATAFAQTADQLQKAADYCNGPLGASSPECQVVMPTLETIPQPRSGLAGNPSLTSPATPRELHARLPQPPARVPGPYSPKEFQRFAAASVGKILPDFGAALFERVPTTFAPRERVPVTADYVIG